ncbi:response regulator transcription factor [Olivibacter sp. SDN3]|uniref:LytR/AlgR family response regulator transcription factor n=1 Tax=Olivibacter sp. SDN3 TaxID=2764720 RepID=UPI0016510CF9|nr:LytTR family DNA-binding domain-containing protein [Olivibacter sp. SDN3]QNL48254.1 response regulator transcription factor [Olivibacter sp. SDN3]
MIRAIAIDDEPFALEVIQKLSAKVPYLQLDGTFTNAFHAIEQLQTQPVDLLFLDIKMPDISGIDFFNSLQHKPLVVFTTAYAEHAVTSFDLDAVDYLLKPFSLIRFIKACNKAKELLNIRHVTRLEETDFMMIKSGYDLLKVFLDDILYLEASGNYVTFVTFNQTFTSRMTLAECTELLTGNQFIRIHRSFIINKKAIDKLERHQVSIQGHTLPVASSYRKEFLSQVHNS